MGRHENGILDPGIPDAEEPADGGFERADVVVAERIRGSGVAGGQARGVHEHVGVLERGEIAAEGRGGRRIREDHLAGVVGQLAFEQRAVARGTEHGMVVRRERDLVRAVVPVADAFAALRGNAARTLPVGLLAGAYEHRHAVRAERGDQQEADERGQDRDERDRELGESLTGFAAPQSAPHGPDRTEAHFLSSLSVVLSLPASASAAGAEAAGVSSSFERKRSRGAFASSTRPASRLSNSTRVRQSWPNRKSSCTT